MQEEADVIMIQHMIAISEELDGAGIRVMCDDTDVFVLLLHFYRIREMSCSLTMESLARDSKCVDIRATATKHKEISQTSWQHTPYLVVTQWPSVGA